MGENQEKIKDLLKKFTLHIENIHDNYASIQNLDRQKKIADGGEEEVLNSQIEEIKKILLNNQTKAFEFLERIIETVGSSVKEHCKKLKSDFEKQKDNPDLLLIQEDINLIKKAI